MSAKEKTVLEYLNLLRETGVVNMYQSGPYLERDLGLNKRECREYITRYMRSTVRGKFAPAGGGDDGR